MHGLVYIAFGLLTGAFFASQGPINGRLAAHLGGPAAAAFMSFSVGWAGLFLFNLTARTPLPSGTAVGAAPGWAWLGGLLGANRLRVRRHLCHRDAWCALQHA